MEFSAHEDQFYKVPFVVRSEALNTKEKKLIQINQETIYAQQREGTTTEQIC